MAIPTLQKQSRQSPTNQLRLRVLEEARDAVTKLRILRPLLSPQDQETLAILMDQELMRRLDKSLQEATSKKMEPLTRILV